MSNKPCFEFICSGCNKVFVMFERWETLPSCPNCNSATGRVMFSGYATFVEGKESLKAGDNGLPDWIPLDAWNGYIEMRKSKKFLLTDRAKSLLVKKLEAFKKDGWNLETLLDEATLGNWKSVYLPDNKSATKGQQENKKSHFGEHVELTEEESKALNAKNNASRAAFITDIASLEQGE